MNNDELGYLALYLAIINKDFLYSEEVIGLLNGKKKKIKLSQECCKLAKIFTEVESKMDLNLKISKEDAETLYKFTSLIDTRFELTLFDRMLLTEEEGEKISEALYNLNEILRKVLK